MDWDEVLKIITAALASVGGAGAIFLVLSSWVGRVWANKILEADRAKYQREIDVLTRYSRVQFDQYNQIWTSLCDLKYAAEALWDTASQLNAKKFAKQIAETEKQIDRGRLLIEENHYAALNNVLEQFSDFQIGKDRLIDLRSMQTRSSSVDYEIQETLNQNGQIRDHYLQLLDDVALFFKSQISEPR